MIDFNYSLFYTPTRVVEEFNKDLENKLKAPVIKRKLSAMIYTTMKTRELVYKNIYVHRFGKLEIFVNHSTRIIRKVSYSNETEKGIFNFRVYRDLCNKYELNADRNDFVGMKKKQIYGKDRLHLVQNQIKKKPNRIMWSDDNGLTWNKLIDDIKYCNEFDTTSGFSIIDSKKVEWIYKLKE